jgi:hypothetical protein
MMIVLLIVNNVLQNVLNVLLPTNVNLVNRTISYYKISVMVIVVLVTGEMSSIENANHVTKPVKPVPVPITTDVSPVSSEDSSTKENVN